MLSGLIDLGFFASIAGFVVFLLLKFFLPGYFTEKGKNLATKEDISEITKSVEAVKTNYAKMLEELKSNNQLKHAKIEREKNIKKEVYLEAVGAISGNVDIIIKLSNLSLDGDLLQSAIDKHAGSISKVQIVGSKETVEAVTAIMSATTSAIVELILERQILLDRKSMIETNEGLRQKAADEVDRYIMMMKKFNLEKNGDATLWESINKQFDFESKQRDKYHQEVTELTAGQRKEQIFFTQKCMEHHYGISSLIPDAVLSVRKELNLEIQSDSYQKIFNDSLEKRKEIFDDFFMKISTDLK